MKSTYMGSNYQISLELLGEKWKQDDLIRGKVNFQNTGTSELVLQDWKISLAYGDYKQVRAKDNKCWKIVNEIDIPERTIAPGENFRHSINLKIDKNSPVTDKSGSLFILIHNEEFFHLEIKVELQTILQEYIRLWENFYRYSFGAIKNKKDGAEVKLKAPKNKGNIDPINNVGIIFNFDDKNNLNAKFNFSINKLDAGIGKVNVKKAKKVINKSMTEQEYQIDRDMINQEALLPKIEEIIKEAKPKLI